ncbi:MAG: MoxR family ATPase [Dehalococcoidia bacterium]|nr:MoxR family ATPase [Dehalococcoidia bacterium]
MASAQKIGNQIIANVQRVIVGNEVTVRLGVAGLIAGGHVLVEGVPGIGKTMLAKSLACSIGVSFKRIQCTADLLPSDVTGTYIFDQRTQEFSFRPGPIMANIVLVDEINRASPKTQSAMLECMEEHQATIDGAMHRMPDPFLIIATRNPGEYSGTFPLPETELDRFLLRVRLDYPSSNEEVAVLEQQVASHPIDSLEAVVEAGDITSAQRSAREIYADPLVMKYIVDLAAATRQHPSVYLGASPRASIGMLSLAKAWALISERDYVTPDDVKAVASAVMSHRLVLNASGRNTLQGDAVIGQILDTIPVPDTTSSGGIPFLGIGRKRN